MFTESPRSNEKIRRRVFYLDFNVLREIQMTRKSRVVFKSKLKPIYKYRYLLPISKAPNGKVKKSAGRLSNEKPYGSVQPKT